MTVGRVHLQDSQTSRQLYQCMVLGCKERECQQTESLPDDDCITA